MDTGLLLVKALIFGMIFTGVLGFFFINFMSRNTEGAVSRLNKETELVRTKQGELNTKIKKRRMKSWPNANPRRMPWSPK